VYVSCILKYLIVFKKIFFQRPDIPDNVKLSTSTSLINTTAWGLPSSAYPATACNITQFFPPQNLVLLTTLCGVWCVVFFLPRYSFRFLCQFRAGVPDIYRATCQTTTNSCVSIIFTCPSGWLMTSYSYSTRSTTTSLDPETSSIMHIGRFATSEPTWQMMPRRSRHHPVRHLAPLLPTSLLPAPPARLRLQRLAPLPHCPYDFRIWLCHVLFCSPLWRCFLDDLRLLPFRCINDHDDRHLLLYKLDVDSFFFGPLQND